MGQIVTDVTIENGKLTVWYGPCCSKVLGDASSLTSTVDDTENVPDELQPEETGNDRTCQKAWNIVNHLFTMLDLLEQCVLGAEIKPYPFDTLKSAYPGVSFDTLDLLQIIVESAGLELANFGFLRDMSDTMSQTYVCRLASAFENTWAISSAEFDTMKSMAHTVFSKIQASLLIAMINAVGRGDWSKLALAAAADTTTRDCACPGADVWFTIPDESTWAYLIDFTAGKHGFDESATGKGWTSGLGFYADIVKDDQSGNWAMVRAFRASDTGLVDTKLLYLAAHSTSLPTGTHMRNPLNFNFGGSVFFSTSNLPLLATYETYIAGGVPWGSEVALNPFGGVTFDAGPNDQGRHVLAALVLAGTGTPPFSDLENLLA